LQRNNQYQLNFLGNFLGSTLPLLYFQLRWKSNWIQRSVIGHQLRMTPQYPNCGLIAICGIAEHCGFWGLNVRNSVIRNYLQFRN
jgi:hypothetical protein